jgi:hypothetical protein
MQFLLFLPCHPNITKLFSTVCRSWLPASDSKKKRNGSQSEEESRRHSSSYINIRSSELINIQINTCGCHLGSVKLSTWCEGRLQLHISIIGGPTVSKPNLSISSWVRLTLLHQCTVMFNCLSAIFPKLQNHVSSMFLEVAVLNVGMSCCLTFGKFYGLGMTVSIQILFLVS